MIDSGVDGSAVTVNGDADGGVSVGVDGVDVDVRVEVGGGVR